MPDPKVCNRIANPAARRRCLEYRGEFSDPGAGPAAAPRVGGGRAGRGLGGPGGGLGRGLGGPKRRPLGRRGGGGFGGGGY